MVHSFDTTGIPNFPELANTQYDNIGVEGPVSSPCALRDMSHVPCSLKAQEAISTYED